MEPSADGAGAAPESPANRAALEETEPEPDPAEPEEAAAETDAEAPANTEAGPESSDSDASSAGGSSGQSEQPVEPEPSPEVESPRDSEGPGRSQQAVDELAAIANPLNARAVTDLWERAEQRGTGDFTFLVVGGERGSRETATEVLHRAIDREDPLFIINTGDFSLTGQPVELRELARNQRVAGVPRLMLAGETELATGAYSQFIGSPNFWFDVGDKRFIFVNNADGSFGASDRYFLRQKLTGVGERKQSFVFMHFPPRTGPWSGDSAYPESDALFEILAENPPTMVFAGHETGYTQKFVNGINLIAGAGLGADSPYYIRVRVAGQQAVYGRVSP